jgi:hypothetical protein
VQSPVTGTVAACATVTVSEVDGVIVAVTPEALNVIRLLTRAARSSMVGVTIGNVAVAAYLSSVAVRRSESRLCPWPS